MGFFFTSSSPPASSSSRTAAAARLVEQLAEAGFDPGQQSHAAGAHSSTRAATRTAGGRRTERRGPAKRSRIRILELDPAAVTWRGGVRGTRRTSRTRAPRQAEDPLNPRGRPALAAPPHPLVHAGPPLATRTRAIGPRRVSGNSSWRQVSS